jgi:hypothetical protein
MPWTNGFEDMSNRNIKTPATEAGLAVRTRCHDGPSAGAHFLLTSPFIEPPRRFAAPRLNQDGELPGFQQKVT